MGKDSFPPHPPPTEFIRNKMVVMVELSILHSQHLQRCYLWDSSGLRRSKCTTQREDSTGWWRREEEYAELEIKWVRYCTVGDHYWET